MSVRLLVVDRDSDVRAASVRALVAVGYDVVAVADTEAAHDAIARGWFDGAVVDHTDVGVALLAHLRRYQPGCVRVLLSQNADLPALIEALNRGDITQIVRRPFEPGALADTIREAFVAQRTTAQAATEEITGVQDRGLVLDALDRKMLDLALQPIVRPDGHIIAYEALLRSRHPILGAPMPMIAAAERCRAIPLLGRHVFSLAAERLATLPVDVGLFVNLHAAQLVEPELLREAVAPLLPNAGRVTMEITERGNLYAIPTWERAIQALDAMGFQLAVDDVGAGNNSLSMLADIEPRYIKIDMSLVRNSHKEPRKQRLIQLLVTFASATGAEVVAEGVETAEEADAVVKCGAHLLQGYFYGRPVMQLAA